MAYAEHTTRPGWGVSGPALCLIAAIFLTGCEGERMPAAAASGPACRIAQTAVPLADEISEASGAAVSRTHRGTIWLHNDSGNDPVLFAVDAAGQMHGRVSVTGARNIDWEDLALGPCPSGECLYIADTGDNAARRDEIHVYRVPEPAPGDSVTAPAERFAMRYPDGPRDAEAIFILPPERLHIVTKGSRERIEIYAYPGRLQPGTTATLTPVRALSESSVPFPDLVTGADANSAGSWVAIRTYTSVLLYPTPILFGATEAVPLRVDATSIGETQGEAVALGDNGALILAGEGGGGGIPGLLAVLWCELSRGRATAGGGSAPQGES